MAASAKSANTDPPPYAEVRAGLLTADQRKAVVSVDGDEEVVASNERIRAMSLSGELPERLHIDADKVLTALGRYPPYQMFVVCLLGFMWIFFAFQIMSMALVAEYHPYTCVGAQDDYSSLLPLLTNDTPVIYDMQCSVLDANGTQHYCDGTEGSNYTLLFDPSFGETMVSEFGLVCGRRYMAHLASTIYMLGSGVSSVVLAQVADMVGRKLVFLASYWTAIALTILIPHLPSYTLIAVARFVLGCAVTGLITAGWVLQSESVAPHQRAFFLSGSLNMIWVVGYMILGVAAMYIPNWRTMCSVLAYPFVTMVFLYWLVPESLHWLVAQKLYGRAIKLIDRLQKWNCKTVELAKCQKDYIGRIDRPKRTLLDVLKSPVLMICGLITCYNGVTAMMVYYGLSLFSTRLSSDRFTGYFLSGLIEIPAGITAPLLLIWVGRKKVLIGAAIMQLAGLLGLSFARAESPEWLRITLYLVAKYGNISVFPGNFLIETEMFPTTVRTVAHGFLGTVSTVGSVAAPFVGGLTDIDPRLPNAIFAFMTAISICLSFVLPETKDTELPEDLDEVQPGPVLGRWFKAERRVSKIDQ